MPLAKNIKRFFSCNKQLLIAAIALAVSVCAGCAVFALLEKDVVIYIDGKTITCKTMKSTFKEVLEQNDIVVGEYDYVSVPPETSLHREEPNIIYIKRAVPVYITADGKQTKIMTCKETVKEMLEDSPVKPEGLDRLEGAEFSDKIEKDMKLTIVRVEEKLVQEKESIPFSVEKKANNKLDEGMKKIVRPGKEGILERQYKVVIEDGVEVSRQLIKETVLQNPVNMIMEYGTLMSFKTSRGDVIRYSKVLNMKATAYTSSLKDTGKAPGHPLFGITATGIKARKGVIAVDPKVIPLYTRVYVEIPGSTPDYGFAIAADVGGAIKGNKIDLYFGSQEYADSFGVKKVRVYILADN